ncbi:cytochrome P450 [Desarmillaria tabescens]|uniref:Cytochrome P450 n=1 Tax=Armillaria tabescens TaxID=1929756 RepID=A0AA39JSC6_ARMTA|nr:cytochrome P450 [Desarmillaria tabescens]KAK0446574.1 cytochrome P450 [Desarmillaria tabescens]
MATSSIAVASLLVALLFHWWFKRPSVKHIKGPPSPSFWLGHQRVLRNQDNAGDLETKWCREYGTLYRTEGGLGQDILVVCDSKALEHIFDPSCPYPKSKEIIFVLSLIGGKDGLAIVDGEPHHRQRKILNPAFSSAQLRNSRVIFQQCSDKLVDCIKESLTGADDIVDIHDWTSKVSLDIIGLAFFRYDFCSLDGLETELEQAMRHLFTASQANPSAPELILVTLIRMLPDSVLGLLRLVPIREIRQLLSIEKVAKKTAREIMARHNEVQTPEGDGDIVNILAGARLAGKMQDDEIEAQLMTFVTAGHETSSSKLKQSNDYDSMPFLNAAIKESLRLHPNMHSLMRTAPHDDVLPLSKGKTLAVPKGQTFACSAYLYNRLPSLWGDDAEEWNPARFFDTTLSVSRGVYANLMTFGAGPRSCIGWRFAIMETQTIIANLILHFEFGLPEGGIEIMQFPGSPAVVPIVKGKAHLGSQLPLRVRALT